MYNGFPKQISFEDFNQPVGLKMNPENKWVKKDTLNTLLDQEAAELTNAAKYERSNHRNGYRSGHYSRNLQTTAGTVSLKIPKLKGIPFETAIIERYRRRESSLNKLLSKCIWRVFLFDALRIL